MSATTVDVRRMEAIIAYAKRLDVRVVEIDGWRSRGVALPYEPKALFCHWDASTINSGEWGALPLVIGGRGGANPVPGPLSQHQVARCLDDVPKFAVVAAGRANHAGLGGPYRLPNGLVIPEDSGNRWAASTEHACNGVGERPNEASLYAYSVLAAAYRVIL